jgi:sarcosine oxidase/L-pipecolate oxidase
MSLENSVFPEKWKKANVIPVHKKDETSDVKNHRPISLLCIVAKVMERCVHHHIYDFLDINNFFCENQSGFIAGDSTINQLLDIYNDVGKASDSGKEVQVVFCDISKAFDRVWHKGLLYKLELAGISGKALVS